MTVTQYGRMVSNKQHNVQVATPADPSQNVPSYPAVFLQRAIVFPGQTAPLVLEGKMASDFASSLGENERTAVLVPSGAIPKDGPSAGIAIAAALASMLTGRAVRKEVALTGEVTLSGNILSVGGIKEKILAAHRAGVTEVVLPPENRKHLVDVPKETRKALRFRFVKHMDDVLRIALK